jgi:hypothetical protein
MCDHVCVWICACVGMCACEHVCMYVCLRELRKLPLFFSAYYIRTFLNSTHHPRAFIVGDGLNLMRI